MNNMKAIIKYNLDDQDDSYQYKIAINASNMCSLIHDIKDKFRTKIKYAPDIMEESYLKALQDMQEDFYSLINEHNLQFILD